MRGHVATLLVIACCLGWNNDVAAQDAGAPPPTTVAPSQPPPVVEKPADAPAVAPEVIVPPPEAEPDPKGDGAVTPDPIAPEPVAVEPVVPEPQTQADVSPQAVATGQLQLTSSTATAPNAAERDDSDEPSVFFRDLLFGPVGKTLGNTMYRGAFYEFGATYESAPWLGDGAVLSGVVFRENHGPIFNTFLAIAAAAGAAASRQTHVYSHSDSNYHYYRGMSAQERAAEDARIAGMIDNAADIASERPLSMTARLYSENLGSSMTGGQLSVGYPIWINAWSGGIIIEPAVSFAYAALHRDSNLTGVRGDTLGWFGGELDLRIPILPFVGIVSHVLYGLTGDKLKSISVGGEATLGNRFVLRGSLQQTSINNQSIFGTSGLRIELAVRL